VHPYRAAVFEALAVLVAFTGVAMFATWPLVVHPLGGFYGFGNDNWGGMPYFDWLHHAYLGSGKASVDPHLQAPFGLDIPQLAIQPMDRLFSLVLGGFGNGLGAYNAQIFLSFVLAGCTMYLLARYITGSKLAALVAGIAFTFSPFHLSLAMQYNALASIQWIPLFLLALIVLLCRRRRRDAVLAGAAFALVAVTSYYYAWFVAWFTLLVVGYFLAAAVVRRRRQPPASRAPLGPSVRLMLARTALSVGVAIVLAGPLLVPSVQGAARAGSAAIEHPIGEAVRYSARPWLFFIPPQDNPIVGDHVRPWVVQHLFDSPVYEQSIYLGYTLLALAVVALWPSRRRSDLPERLRFARGIFAVGAVVGLLFTLGPYLPLTSSYWRLWATPGATAHLPSFPWIMFHLGPVFRFFTRAFVLVSACLAVLAAIGLARIERRSFMTPVRSILLTAAVVFLIGAEFANAPPHHWYSAKAPPWVQAVKRLPAGASIVEYPLATANSPRSLYYMFWETKHRRATVNPQVTPQAEALGTTISSPDDPATGKALHRAGIDYAVVHTRLPPQTTVPYQPELPDDSLSADTGALNPWFRVAARTPDAVVYRVLGAPHRTAGALARIASGFSFHEQEGAYGARWLQEPSGTLTLYVTGRRRQLGLLLTVTSFAQPRGVTVRLDGHVLAAFGVPASGYITRAVPLGAPAPGTHTIELSTRPGPQSVHATTGSPDTRFVSIRLREPVQVVAAHGHG
jgi:hypothetical protein